MTGTSKICRFIDKYRPYVIDATIPVLNYTAISVNSLNTVNQATTALKKNLNKITAERALFSRYLVHMVGDIHQPLHSVALFNRTFPKGDQGGNYLKIQMLNGTFVNFHAFWDSGAFLLQNDTYQFVRPLNLQNMTEIKRMAAQMTAKYGKEVEQDAKEIDPLVWMKESFLIAQNTTYPFVMKTNIANEEYTNLVYETSKKRITLAGYRIANIVMNIFNPKSTLEQRDINQSWNLLYEHAKECQQKIKSIKKIFNKNLNSE